METIQVTFVMFLVAVCAATEAYGRECIAGQERDSDGQLHRVINEKDPDGCTDLRWAGGLNMQRQVNPYVEKIVPSVETQTQSAQNYECHYHTEPSKPHTFRYIMGPLSMPFKVVFKVMSPVGLMIALAERNATDSIFAEITIGGWSNSLSVIRACHSDVCKDLFGDYYERGILNEAEYRPFWIEYIEGVVTVGKGGQQEAFSQWDAGAYNKRVTSEVYFGISGAVHGADSWVFNTTFVCK